LKEKLTGSKAYLYFSGNAKAFDTITNVMIHTKLNSIIIPFYYSNYQSYGLWSLIRL